MAKKRYTGKYLRKKPAGSRGVSVVLGILLVLFAASAIFGGWKYFTTRQEYQAGTDSYAALAGSAVTEGAVEETVIYMEAQREEEGQTPSNPEALKPPQTTAHTGFRVDFDLLRSINSQTVGWISGLGGAVNYPVVQAADNDYYLDHLFDGTSNRSGSIFMDFRNAAGLTDRNTFIYGHNMLNGSMFAALTNYGSQSYYEEYPELTLVTPSGTWSLQAFSGYVTPGNSDCYQLEFRDDAEFEAYLERVRLLSDFTADVAVTAQDRIVTLSTCTYDYEDARYVLHCKLVPMQ